MKKVGEALVATGAEDSTVRLWDLRGAAAEGSSRVARCLCRCFDGEAVTSVVFAAGSANTLYCSAGGKVRHQTTAVLLIRVVLHCHMNVSRLIRSIP